MRARIVRPPRDWWRHRAPAVLAISGAAAFVILRIAYRLIFGGIPRFDDMWVELLLAILRSSLPVIAIIVLFGLANTVFDLRAVLARFAARGPVKNLRTALVIGLSSYPALLQSVAEVRTGRRLRNERSLISILVPVLEKSLERGVRLGMSMQQRGFGVGSDHLFGMCDAPIVARNVRLGFGSASMPDWTLEVENLRINQGECLLITGPTGSGKSAFLHALSGVLQHSGHGWHTGVLEVGGIDRQLFAPHETASFVSIVEQNVKETFVATSVIDELAFAPRMHRVPEEELTRRISDVVARLRITHLLDRETGQLSAGEATLVAIAAAIVSRPSLLLLDEPIADLDSVNTQMVVNVLSEIRATTGITLVIAEHRWSDLTDIADWRLDLGSTQPNRPHNEPLNDSPADGEPIPVTALCAPNGAGKTTWLQSFATKHPQQVRLVPEDPAILFSRDSVKLECARNDVLVAREAGSTERLLTRLLPTVPLDVHPRDLSMGQRLGLACALQASANPSLLLIDEPTRGLDGEARSALAELLRYLARHGTSVIFATHDIEFARQFGRASPPAVPAKEIVS